MGEKTMTRDDVVRLAREAGCLDPGKGGDPNGLWEPDSWANVTELMHNFAALVAAAEREECAKLAEEPYEFTSDEAHRIAAAIRARGEK